MKTPVAEHKAEKGVAYEPFDAERWPNTADSYYLGLVNSCVRIFAIVDKGEWIGAEMFAEGMGLSVPRKENMTNEDFLARLEKFQLAEADKENYEMAGAILEARNLLNRLKLK